MSKLPITFQQGKLYIIPGEVPDRKKYTGFDGHFYKAKYREAIAVLPRLEIINEEVFVSRAHGVAFKKNFPPYEECEYVDGEIYFVDGEYDKIPYSPLGLGIAKGECQAVAYRAFITLSNTIEQKSGSHSYTESAEVGASIEEKGPSQEELWIDVSNVFTVAGHGEAAHEHLLRSYTITRNK